MMSKKESSWYEIMIAVMLVIGFYVGFVFLSLAPFVILAWVAVKLFGVG